MVMSKTAIGSTYFFVISKKKAGLFTLRIDKSMFKTIMESKCSAWSMCQTNALKKSLYLQLHD